MKQKPIFLIAVFVLGICLIHGSAVAAQEETGQNQEQIQEELMKEFDFKDLDQSLKQIFPKEKLTFGKIVENLISQETKFSLQTVGDLIKDKLFYELNYNRKTLVHILLIAIIAAVFTNFSSIFQNKQASEISFYILYLLLITICLSSFQVIMISAEENLQLLISFMKILGPIYFLGVALASGSVSSVAFYNIVLLLIFLVELLIINFLIPLIHVHIMVKIVNQLSEEDYLSKLAELLETIVSWTLKTLLACIVGLNVIQGLLSPAIDSLKRSILTKGAEAIPGVGDAIGGVTQVVLGTAVLIKNGIGTAGAVVCIIICIVPLLQMAVMTLLYKFTAAIIQPVSDKRIVNCISSIGDGCQMLLKVTFTSGVLFLITIAVVAATTT